MLRAPALELRTDGKNPGYDAQTPGLRSLRYDATNRLRALSLVTFLIRAIPGAHPFGAGFAVRARFWRAQWANKESDPRAARKLFPWRESLR